MKKIRTSLLGSALVVLLAPGLVSCDDPGSPGSPLLVCNQIGCTEGLSVRVSGDTTGSLTIEVSVAFPSFVDPQEMRCAPMNGSCGAFFENFVHETTLTIRVLNGDNTVAVRQVNPLYEVHRPNGPDCPPECRQAVVEIVLQ